MTEKKKKNRLERYVYKRLTKKGSYSSDDRHHILNEQEQAELKRIRNQTFWKAGLTGAIAILVLYLPKYAWPEWFVDTHVWVPYLDEYYDVPIIFLVYSLVLVIIEIAILTSFNISAVQRIAQTCGYPDPKEPHYESDVNALIAVGLERKQKSQTALGINPFVGLTKLQLLAFTLFNLMKAALTNMLFKLIVRRFLGRYALRILVDLAGVPVYAFWNAWAANRVMNETRVRVMAAPIIKELARELVREQKDNPEFIKELYYILDYIAIVKRTFHYNHYLLSVTMLKEFGQNIDPEHQYDPQFLKRIEESSDLTKSGFSKLMLFGMIIDGSLSKKEEYLIYKMKKGNYFDFTREQAKKWTKDYFEGRGLEELVYYSDKH